MASRQIHGIVLVFLCVQVLVAGLALSSKELRFRRDGTFKIVQFTDLHYGEMDLKDMLTARAQSTVLKHEKPDLVIMTGDSVSGYAWDYKPGWFEPKWKKLVKPMIDHETRWATAIGNHDDQADFNRSRIAALDMSFPLSLTQTTDTPGLTNYVLSVLPFDTGSSKIVSNLWIFGTTNTNCLGVHGWGCIMPETIEWYRQKSASLREQNGNTKIPGLAFFHIPPPEFMDLWNKNVTHGHKKEDICCFSVNTGAFSAFSQDIISIHCGHDHNNDYLGEYNGIRLAYGRKSGYGGYGPPLGWLHGARVIKLRVDSTGERLADTETWIRLEDGLVAPKPPIHNPDPSSNQTRCCGTSGFGRVSNCEQYEQSFREKVSTHRP